MNQGQGPRQAITALQASPSASCSASAHLTCVAPRHSARVSFVVHFNAHLAVVLCFDGGNDGGQLIGVGHRGRSNQGRFILRNCAESKEGERASGTERDANRESRRPTMVAEKQRKKERKVEGNTRRRGKLTVPGHSSRRSGQERRTDQGLQERIDSGKGSERKRERRTASTAEKRQTRLRGGNRLYLVARQTKRRRTKQKQEGAGQERTKGQQLARRYRQRKRKEKMMMRPPRRTKKQMKKRTKKQKMKRMRMKVQEEHQQRQEQEETRTTRMTMRTTTKRPAERAAKAPDPARKEEREREKREKRDQGNETKR